MKMAHEELNRVFQTWVQWFQEVSWGNWDYVCDEQVLHLLFHSNDISQD
jgi:hypothetical protein